MFIATLDAHHCSFLAVGDTEKDARAAMRRAWQAHKAQYPRDYGLHSWAFLADGVNVVELQPGEAARDGSLIGARRA